MRYVICAVVSCFACGCGQKSPPTKPAIEPYLPAEIRLPEASGAEPLGKDEPIIVYLNVNEQGKVLLAPGDRWTNSDGKVIEALDDRGQLLDFLARRERDYYATISFRDKNLVPRPVVVMRVDARTPFEKTSSVALAAIQAGYAQFQWRALRPAGAGEGRIEIIRPFDRRHADDTKGWFFARVTAEAGKIAKITLHENEDEAADAGIDLGTDPESLLKRLRELNEVALKNEESVELTLQIDGRLLQADVIRLLDAAARAKIKGAMPLLLDPKKP